MRAFLRDRLAGVDVPFEVRGFVETVWADYLSALRREHGPESDEWNAAVRTLDDMLWSIVAKERTAQKARLTKMIPALIGALRKGCAALGIAPERARAFFESLYELHIAAIKPKPESAPAAVPAPLPQPAPPAPIVNVHDYVSEMAVGTWLAFNKEGARHQCAADLGEPAAHQVPFHQPLARAGVRVHARRARLRARRRQGHAGGRAGAAVRSRGQRRARHARRAATFGNATPAHA